MLLRLFKTPQEPCQLKLAPHGLGVMYPKQKCTDICCPVIIHQIWQKQSSTEWALLQDWSSLCVLLGESRVIYRAAVFCTPSAYWARSPLRAWLCSGGGCLLRDELILDLASSTNRLLRRKMLITRALLRKSESCVRGAHSSHPWISRMFFLPVLIHKAHRRFPCVTFMSVAYV